MPFLLATLHLLALGIGLGAIWARARALRGALDAAGIRRALAADTWWGVAAALWIGTGLLRAFGGWEKGSAYYLQNHVFWGKMLLLAIILALEIWPMMTLIRWRIALAKGQTPDTGPAKAIAGISEAQVALVVLIVAAAVAMARGVGAMMRG